MPRQVLSLCSRTLPALSAAAFALALGAACNSPYEAPRVAVSTNLAVPKGLLDRVTRLSLTVLEGSVTCGESDGQIVTPDGAAGAREIAKRDLQASGCAAGVRFCGELSIERSDAIRVFSATATGPDGATIAIGCAQAKVDADAVPVAIKLLRYLAPANCSDGVLQPTEQCTASGTAICDDACLTTEVLLSIGSSQNGTQPGGPGDKTDPFLVWPQLSGTQGRFFAFYTDRAVAGSDSNVEVALRAMNAEMSPIPANESPALAAGSIYLPNGATFPPPPAPYAQSAPSAAFLQGKYYVAFEDDTRTATTGQDVRLRSMDGALVADGTAPLGINGGVAGTGSAGATTGPGSGEAGVQGAPSMAAGPRDRLFVAWEDSASGKIAGRTLSPPATLGNQNDLSAGSGNTGVSVASTATGWVAVWQSGSRIKLRVINADGTPQGAEQNVDDGGSATERPRVASLPDGRFAVTWSAHGDVFVQRYDATGVKIADEQAIAINDVVTEGAQITPSIAAAPAAGGSYVVAWLDAASGHVRARMLGGSEGFLFNNVNGQSTEFQASRADGRTRAHPAVVVGGSGPFVAIAWEDKGATGAGIVARRLPLPAD